MKPVNQTEFDGVGNWYTACLASILDIPLLEIPHLSGRLNYEDTWFDRTQAWLMTRGLYAIVLNEDEPANGYYIGIGINSANNVHGAIFIDNTLIHDPHPARAGLQGQPEIRIVINKFNYNKRRIPA